MRKRKLRIAPLLFAVVLVFLEMVGCLCVPDRDEIVSIKATGVGIAITAELTEELLLKLVCKMAGDYVEGVVADKIQHELGIDPAPVLSDSHFVRWNEPDRVKAYIVENGSQRLAETWYELNKQFLNTNGVVDKEYYVSFYHALINDITDNTNDVFDVLNNAYANSMCNFNNLSDAVKKAFLTYPIYMFMLKRKNDGTAVSQRPYVFFLNDIYYGVYDAPSSSNGSYVYRAKFGDIVARADYPSYPAVTILDRQFAKKLYLLPGQATTEMIDFSKYRDDAVKCCIDNFYEPSLASYGYADGFSILHFGLTPKGAAMLNKGVDDDHLRKTLNMCKNSSSQLPIYLQKPDTDGKNVDDYYGNDNITVLHLDNDDTDNISPAFTVTDDDIVIQNEDDVNNLDTSPVDKNDAAKKKWGWLSFLFEWFQKIIDAILSLVTGIVDGILNGLGNVLKALFVPSDDFFTTHFTNIKTTLAEKFGFSNYDLLFDALKNCAKGSWDFSGDFTILGHEFHLTMIDVDEWFTDENLNKLHYILRGLIYPLLAIANVHFLIWFLRGNVFNVGTAISQSANPASDKGSKGK